MTFFHPFIWTSPERETDAPKLQIVMNYCLIRCALDAHRFDFMQKCFAPGSNYSTSLGFIIRQTFPSRTPRPGNVELHHLGEIARRNSRTDFTESLSSRGKIPSKHNLNRKPIPFTIRVLRGDLRRFAT